MGSTKLLELSGSGLALCGAVRTYIPDVDALAQRVTPCSVPLGEYDISRALLAERDAPVFGASDTLPQGHSRGTVLAA